MDSIRRLYLDGLIDYSEYSHLLEAEDCREKRKKSREAVKRYLDKMEREDRK